MSQRTSAVRRTAMPEEEALPAEVRALAPRMREIASVIYESGGATVRDVQRALADPPTIYGIRTLLIRLTKRGIVKCRPSGKHTEILYLPAILTRRAREAALNNFIVRHFDGSSFDALQIALRLASADPATKPPRRHLGNPT